MIQQMGAEHILAHQTLDPVKARAQALSQQIMPNTSCAIGPVAGREALADGRKQDFILQSPFGW